jgi:hypothetical protein
LVNGWFCSGGRMCRFCSGWRMCADEAWPKKAKRETFISISKKQDLQSEN